MRKILNKIKEFRNGEKLQTIQPSAIVFDMYHLFANKKTRGANIASKTMDEYIRRGNDEIFNFQKYQNSTSDRQAFLHYVTFSALFDMYIEHLKPILDDTILPQPQNIDTDTIIDFVEYEKLPKRYRGIFAPYGDDYYTLNAPQKSMVITFHKSDREKLIQLLRTAQMYINVLPNVIFIGKESDNIFDKGISEEQLNAILQLRVVFQEIAKITLPRPTNPEANKTSGARQIFNEYQNELTHKNAIVRNAKTNGR